VAIPLGFEILDQAPKKMDVRVDVERLRNLLRSITSEVEPSKYMVVKRRVEAFVRKMFPAEKGVMSNEG